MFKHLVLAVALLPVAAHAESTHIVLTARDDGALKLSPGVVMAAPKPPGLSFVLPAPIYPKPAVPPKPLMVPLGKLPGPGALLRLPATPEPAAPATPRPPMRLLVRRDDDRAVIRTIHPLLTTDVPVNKILVRPAAPRAKR